MYTHKSLTTYFVSSSIASPKKLAHTEAQDILMLQSLKFLEIH